MLAAEGRSPPGASGAQICMHAPGGRGPSSSGIPGPSSQRPTVGGNPAGSPMSAAEGRSPPGASGAQICMHACAGKIKSRSKSTAAAVKPHEKSEKIETNQSDRPSELRDPDPRAAPDLPTHESTTSCGHPRQDFSQEERAPCVSVPAEVRRRPWLPCPWRKGAGGADGEVMAAEEGGRVGCVPTPRGRGASCSFAARYLG
jgi:hypothetical protein